MHLSGLDSRHGRLGLRSPLRGLSPRWRSAPPAGPRPITDLSDTPTTTRRSTDEQHHHHRPPHPGPRAARAAQRQHPVCRLRLAVDGMGRGGRDEAGYINVTAFGNAGEAAARVLIKGWLVAVDGRLQYGEWETDDGTRRHDYEIVGNVEFLAAPAAPRTAPATRPRPNAAGGARRRLTRRLLTTWGRAPHARDPRPSRPAHEQANRQPEPQPRRTPPPVTPAAGLPRTPRSCASSSASCSSCSAANAAARSSTCATATPGDRRSCATAGTTPASRPRPPATSSPSASSPTPTSAWRPRQHRDGGKAAIAHAWTLWVDCDTPASRRRPAGLHAAAEHRRPLRQRHQLPRLLAAHATRRDRRARARQRGHSRASSAAAPARS